jgi:hypothetical protein
MKELAFKIIDIFIYKYDKRLVKEIKGKFTTFGKTLPFIYEDTLVEIIKKLYIEFNSQFLIMPWMYVFFNEDLALA